MNSAKRWVVIATPSLDHRVSLDFMNAMLDVRLLLLRDGIQHTFIQIGGDCFVAKARNKLATMFLDIPEATDLFFIDDDLGFPAQKVLDFINNPVDILAGVYPKKNDTLDFPATLSITADTRELIEKDGLLMAQLAPTGFMKLTREAVEKLASVSTRMKEVNASGDVDEFANIFETGVGHDGFFWGEDYTLCRKWGSLGGEVWVDPSIPFTHRGNHKWKASLQDHLQTFRDRAKEMQ